MRSAGDVRDEMTNDCFDEAFDRLLAGRPVPAEAALLVAFTDGVRAVASDPGRPSPQLAQLLAAGLPAAATAAGTTAVAAPGPARPSKARRTRARLGVLAAGVGVALAGVTGAGAAGVLPDPIQAPVSNVLEAVTPVEVPDSPEDTSAPVELPVTEEAAIDIGRAPQDVGPPAEDPADFGREVSGDAREGGVDGREVSEQARESHRPDVPPARGPAEHPGAAVPGPDKQADRGPATLPAGPADPASPPDAQPGAP
jgi:hypothetical protein